MWLQQILSRHVDYPEIVDLSTGQFKAVQPPDEMKPSMQIDWRFEIYIFVFFYDILFLFSPILRESDGEQLLSQQRNFFGFLIEPVLLVLGLSNILEFTSESHLSKAFNFIVMGLKKYINLYLKLPIVYNIYKYLQQCNYSPKQVRIS